MVDYWEINALTYTENEIVEVLEEADFSDYAREKFSGWQGGGSVLKLIYEIKPPAQM